MLSMEQYGLIEFGVFVLALVVVVSSLWYATSGKRQARQLAEDRQEH